MYSLDLIPEIDMLNNEDGIVVFEQAIWLESDLDDQNIEIIEAYKNYKSSYIVHTPKEITYYNIGEISEDMQTVIFTYNLLNPDENNSAPDIDLHDSLIVE